MRTAFATGMMVPPADERDVLTRPHPGGIGSLGGAMHEDLRQACFAALAVPRQDARLRALDFSWSEAAALFEGFLVPVRGAAARREVVTPMS